MVLWLIKVEDGVECDGKNITKCTAINRIGRLLERYSKNDKNIFSDQQYLYTKIYDDFHHILLNHKLDLEDIMNHTINKYEIKCDDLSECVSIIRNFRDRSKSNNNLYELIDDDDMHFVQLLDVIHTYLFHSFDLNYKLKKQQIEDIYGEYKDDDQDSNERWNAHKNNQIKQMNKILTENKRKFKHIIGSSTIQNSKFVTKFGSNQETQKKVRKIGRTRERFGMFLKEKKEKMTKIAVGLKNKYYQNEIDAATETKLEHKNDDDMIQKEEDDIMTKYSFGFPYRYWNYYKYGKWFIPKKYKNIKEEILNNKQFSIRLSQLNTQIKKTEQWLDTKCIKELKCKYPKNLEMDQPGKHTDIEQGTPFLERHVLSLIFYCSFDQLSAKFSGTYRKISKKESDKDLKLRHQEFHHFGKSLYESINLYGNDVNSAVFGKYVYHGMDKAMLFDSTVAMINGPISTTTEKPVALHFADEQGMVLKLNKLDDRPGQYQFFNCCIVSDYTGEEERLFLQTVLRIQNIIDVQLNQDYQWYCRAAAVFDVMMGGYPFPNFNIVYKGHGYYYEAVMNGQLEKGDRFKYVNKLIKHITNHEVIRMNLWTMNLKKVITEFNDKKHIYYGYDSIKEFFMTSNCDWIYFDKLLKLCNKLKSISVYNWNMAKEDDEKAIEISTSFTLNSELLNKLNSFLSSSICKKSSFSSLFIYLPSESEMPIDEFIKQFNINSID